RLVLQRFVTVCYKPERQHVAVAQGRRAESRQLVVGAAAENALRRDPAPDRHVRAHAAPARAELEQLPDARDAGRQRALVEPRAGIGSGHADERVPELERGAVGRAGRRHAEVRQTWTSQVLHGQKRARAEDGDARHAATKRTRSPGASSAGSVRCGSKSTRSLRPSRRQPPGDSRGYTAEYGPATATLPAGTRSRGEASRGTCSSSSPPSR